MKYSIEGKVIETDAPLSEAEIDEIASSLKVNGRPAPPPGMDSWVVPKDVQAARDAKALALRQSVGEDSLGVKELYKLNPATQKQSPQKAVTQKVDTVVKDAQREQTFSNLIKQGFSDFVGMSGGVRQQTTDAAKNFAGIATAIATGNTQELSQYGFRSPKEAFSSFIKGYQEAQDATYKLTGAYKTPEPTSIVGRAYEAAVRSLGDPTSIIAPSAKTLGGTALRMLASEAGSAAVSASSVIGGETGKAAEKFAFGTSGTTGQVVGSIGGAFTAPVGQAVVSQAAKATKKATNYVLKTDPEMVQMAQTYGTVNNFLEKIASEQGIDNIGDFVNQWSGISQKVTGKNTPILIGLSDNPAVQAAFTALVKSDPDFRAAVSNELKDVRTALERRANVLVGARNTPIPVKDVVKMDVAEKRLQFIDKAMENVSARISPTQTSETRGQAISTLLDQKEKAARASVSPLYDAVITDGLKDNVRLASTETEKLYKFVQQNRIDDIFGRDTPLGKEVTRILSPRKIEQEVPSQVMGAAGLPRTTTTKQSVDAYPELNAKDIDSLKRALAEAGRKPLNNDERRKLNDLSSVFNTARDTLPSKFNDGLKSADLEYYKKVGVPFNSATIDNLDAKKYAEQVAPFITTTGSKTREFLNAVGNKDGVPVVRNAVLADIYEKAVDPNTGMLNTKRLASYVKQRRDVISQIDGLQDEINGFALDFGKLAKARADLNSAYQAKQSEIAKTYLVSKGYEPNYSKWATELLNEPSQMTKVIEDFKYFPPETKEVVLKNLRREILSKGFDKQEGLEFFTSPTNKATIDKLFGKGYQENVKQLLKLSDAVGRVDPSRVNAVLDQKQLDSLGTYLKDAGVPGLDLPYISSTLRDRISSPTQKVIRLLSRVNVAVVDKQTREGLKELLLDPDGLNKFVSKYKSVDVQKFTNPISVAEMIGDVKSRVPMYLYQAEEGNISGAAGMEKPAQEVPSEFQPMFGSFE